MVAEGEFFRCPSLCYFKYAQKLVFNDKLWGVADMPAILFPLRLRKQWLVAP